MSLSKNVNKVRIPLWKIFKDKIRNTSMPVWYIMSVCLAFFMVTAALPQFTNVLTLNADFLSQPWSIYTSSFFHFDFAHLFFNMLVIFIFADHALKKVDTRKQWATFFLLPLVFGLTMIPFYGFGLQTVGGYSGICMAILAIYIARKMKSYKFIAIWLVLYHIFVFFFVPQVSIVGHIGGFIIGYLWYQFFLKIDIQKGKKFYRKYLEGLATDIKKE